MPRAACGVVHMQRLCAGVVAVRATLSAGAVDAGCDAATQRVRVCMPH